MTGSLRISPSADPASINVDRLANRRVQQRLSALWSQASRRAEHATMRQLMGLVAYILTEGTDRPAGS